MINSPNLFVIGVPKGGTSYVHSLLSSLSGVRMSDVKEPGYFSTDKIYARGSQYYWDTFFNRNEADAKWIGEATPWYFYSETALQRIARDCSTGTRFVVCLREPASRAISMYRDQVRAGYERRAPDEVFRPDYVKYEKASRLEQRYISCGFYAKWLNRWFNVFGRERFLVLTEPDLSDVDELSLKLSSFLEVEGRRDSAGPVFQNGGGDARFRGLNFATVWLARSNFPIKRFLIRVVPDRLVRLFMQRMVRWNRRSGASSVAISGDLSCSLKEIFAESIREVESCLSQDLGHWR